jgi:hypothetical protein
MYTNDNTVNLIKKIYNIPSSQFTLMLFSFFSPLSLSHTFFSLPSFFISLSLSLSSTWRTALVLCFAQQPTMRERESKKYGKEEIENYENYIIEFSWCNDCFDTKGWREFFYTVKSQRNK